MMQVHAVIAEHEARAISKRTREALAAAKARGTVLGANGRKLAEANKQAAVNALAPLRAQLARYADAGLPIRRIAEQLNSEGVGTPAGGRWHPTNVHRALRRLGLR
jgi:DNA invertase Pin-like site-specific DNA recombinase